MCHPVEREALAQDLSIIINRSCAIGFAYPQDDERR